MFTSPFCFSATGEGTSTDQLITLLSASLCLKISTPQTLYYSRGHGLSLLVTTVSPAVPSPDAGLILISCKDVSLTLSPTRKEGFLPLNAHSPESKP